MTVTSNARRLARGAILAGIYAALTVALHPFSYGIMQVRVSEALTVLPFLMPDAVPALFVGVLIANLLGGLGLVDILLGSLATLIAALLTRRMPRAWLAPLPPVVINGLVVGTYLSFLMGFPLLASIAWVSLGQILACYGLGYPLLVYLIRRAGAPGEEDMFRH